MRRLIVLGLFLLVPFSAFAQQRKMKLDSLGLPPFPGAANVGHISLPLKDILKPKPGEHPTGPALNDLAIQTYRTPQTVTVSRIAEFYLKYAQQLGWRLLDDIPDSAANRSLVFWSPAAPGYLTVEVLSGPDNTRQIDLTRLLGDVDPSRSGEVLRLTGKRVREQHVSVIYAGRFLDVKTGKLANQKLASIEERSESGLPPSAAARVAPMDETYAIVVRVTDTTKRMTSADAYTINNVLVAHGEAKSPTGSLTLIGKARATQGLTLRVVVMGAPEGAVTPLRPSPKPRVSTTKPAKSSKTTKSQSAAKTPRPQSVLKQGPVPKPGVPAVKEPAPVAPPVPPRTPVVLTEWYGLRPPRTAMPELRRGAANTQTDVAVLEKDVEAGATCDARFTRPVEWRTETKDKFNFAPDLFGPSFARGQIGVRTGSTMVDFPLRSGTSNKYTLSQVTSTTITQVELGYGFNSQWVILPGKKVNPAKTTYVVVSTSPPTVSKTSTGSCPPVEPKPPASG